MEPQASTSSNIASPRKKRPKMSPFTANEKHMVINVYKYVQQTWSSVTEPQRKHDLVAKTASILCIGEASVYRILKDYKETGVVSSPKLTKTRPTILNKTDEFDKSVIRRKVHSFFLKGELPTLDKLLQVINEDESLPNFSRTGLHRIIKHLKFKYVKRKRDNFLTDRDDIVLWRRKYLKQIQEYRNQNRRIYYMDETWINAGHTNSKSWTDTTITSKRQAFLDGLSIGLPVPTSKGKRLIIVHIGSEEGFVKDCEWVFESKKSGDYHDSMNADNFEKWFEGILPKLGENSVVVMDNAPYHSRRQEKIPNSSWIKKKIQEWLKNKNIVYDDKEIKNELLQKVNAVKENFRSHVIDELAKKHKVNVLRLPPYHCELNPIELIWADIKGFVARHNTSYKFQDVQKLLQNGIKNITPEKWKNCVEHVIKEENKFYQLDYIIDSLSDNIIINVSESDDSDRYSSDSCDE